MSHEDVMAAAEEIAAVEPLMPAAAADSAEEEPNPFEQAAPAHSHDARAQTRSRSHSHSHPHDAHSHAAPLLMGSSHGAYVQAGFDLHSDLVLDADAPSTASAAADDDANPFDTPHLPAHSRAVHHRLDVAPVGADSADDQKLECADEIVPPWREEMRTLLTLALPAVLINLTSVAVSSCSAPAALRSCHAACVRHH